MQNKKVIILIILSIGAAISLIYGITASPRSRSRASRPAQQEAKAARSDGATSSVRRIVPTERLAKKTEFVSWGKNPFALKEVKIETISKLSLNGIMWDEESPKAIVNDEIIGVGDKIDENTVVDIKKDSVILNDGISDFELEMGL